VRNMRFRVAGPVSTNPVRFALGIGLILAWRVAGYYGLDRYLLPRLGVPWHARVNAGHTQPVGAPMPSGREALCTGSRVSITGNDSRSLLHRPPGRKPGRSAFPA